MRQAPDGQWALTAISISLIGGGAQGLLGRVYASLPELERALPHIAEVTPPWEEADATGAAAFAWGAYDLAESYGSVFPLEAGSFMRMFSRPEGTSTERIERLVGPGGLTPKRLAEVVQRNFKPGAADDGREPMIMTSMVFELGDTADALRAFRSAEPDFEEGPKGRFEWTREYPKGHWSPFAALGRQLLGSVQVGSNGLLTAEANTLSMSAVLASKVRVLTRGQLRLKTTTWNDLAAILGGPQGASKES